jgi:GntR family transcriptional regulator/MocR family aminotransferase
MKYSIDKKGGPAYLQLYRLLRSDIARGVFPPGSRLPSKRLLAEELGLSHITVEHALALLCDEGYATARERSGCFVSFRAEDPFLRGDLPTPQPHRPAPPGESGAQTFPFSVLAKAMRGVLSNEGEAILAASPPQGLLSLREAVCAYLRRARGVEAKPEQVVIGAGTEYLYHLIVLLLGREKTIALEDPCYERIAQIYAAEDVRVERLPLGRDGIRAEALRQSAADALHISPYRSFPSGVTASASKRAAYLQWAARGDRYIIEDDFESEFSVSRKYEETLFAHTHQSRVIYLNTFSGTVSPALRVGYMVLPPQLVQPFREKTSMLSCPVPTYVQLVLTQLLDAGDLERQINRVRRRKRKEQEEIRN